MLGGDLRASRAFAERMLTPLHRVATCWVGRFPSLGVEPDDVIQATFMRLFTDDHRRLRAHDPAKGLTVERWVCLIGHQTAISLIRKGMRDRALLRDTEQDPEPWSPSPEPPIEPGVEARRQLERLRSRLVGDDRILFELLLLGREAREIAEILELSEDAITSRITRLRRRMAKILRGTNGNHGPAE